MIASAITIDPGVDRSAYGLWRRDETLIGIGFTADGIIPGVDEIDLVVIERPNIRPNTPNAQDIVRLAWAGAILAGTIAGRNDCPIRELAPIVWKGATPKPIDHGRTWSALTEAERALFPADTYERICAARKRQALARGKPGAKYYGAWTGHNLLDAVGIGLYHFGRRPHRERI